MRKKAKYFQKTMKLKIMHNSNYRRKYDLGWKRQAPSQSISEYRPSTSIVSIDLPYLDNAINRQNSLIML